jgi:hypothetical protein
VTLDALNNNTDNNCLNLSESSRRPYRVLNPTKCPTKTCKECKEHYIDILGLDIFVTCKCKCHKKELGEFGLVSSKTKDHKTVVMNVNDKF